MPKVSVFIPYCYCRYPMENLRLCLEGLAAQTQPVHQIIVADDSHPDDRPAVKAICDEFGAEYIELEFCNYSPQWARKFNRCFEQATGEQIVLLCSNWLLEPTWMEKMSRWLERLGKRKVVACDNARHLMERADGSMHDWYAGYPDRFREPSYTLFDVGFLHMLWRDDWQEWSEEFDPAPGDMSQSKGDWHAVTQWAYKLMVGSGVQLWMRRDMKAEHLREMSERGKEMTKVYLRQIDDSTRLVRAKGLL